MSSESRHRGAHPADQGLFDAAALPALRQAVADLSWLLGHGYARPSALKLVGDRYALTERQRLAVGRAACGDESRIRRRSHQLEPAQMQGREVWVDGFNLLVTLEAFFGGGVLLLCRDGCMRDMSSVHGSYHAVAETDKAIFMAAARLQELQVTSVHWLLDSPVSNSGRLAQRLRDLAAEHGWPWTVETVFNPDTVLLGVTDKVVISSDALIIEGAAAWYNLAADVILNTSDPSRWLMDLRDEKDGES